MLSQSSIKPGNLSDPKILNPYLWGMSSLNPVSSLVIFPTVHQAWPGRGQAQGVSIQYQAW